MGGALKIPMRASWKPARFLRNSTAISLAPARNPGAILEWLEDDEHTADVGDVGAQQDRIARHVDGVSDALGLGDYLIAVLRVGFGALQARAVGQLGVDYQVAFVLLGNEAHGNGDETETVEPQETRRKSNNTITLTRNSPPTIDRSHWRDDRKTG